MAEYSSGLKSWGDKGSEYPDEYSYLEGEQPVDAWDNYLTYHIIRDIKDHLIPLTNKRLESSIGSSEPSSPEDGELIFRTDEVKLKQYTENGGEWHTILYADDAVMEAPLDLDGYQLENVGQLIFSENGGARTLADLPVSETAESGTEQSLALTIGGEPILKAYSEADGSGGIQNQIVEINNADLTLSGNDATEINSLNIGPDSENELDGADEYITLHSYSSSKSFIRFAEDSDGFGGVFGYDGGGSGTGNKFTFKAYDKGVYLELAALDFRGNLTVLNDLNASGTVRVGGNEVWHPNNDGDGSGLDADLLDGKHADDIAAEAALMSSGFAPGLFG